MLCDGGSLLDAELHQKPRGAAVTRLPATQTRAQRRDLAAEPFSAVSLCRLSKKWEWRDARNVEACKQVSLENQSQQGEAEAVFVGRLGRMASGSTPTSQLEANSSGLRDRSRQLILASAGQP
jgi:hypothetical protein